MAPPLRAPSWVLLGVLGVVAAGVAVTQLPPWSFLTRADLPSCGRVNPDPRTGEVPRGAVDCLAAARDGDAGAELQVVAPTEQGDPVRVYYRVVPGVDGLELFVHSPDGPGRSGWTHDRCPEAGTLPDIGTCRRV